MKHKAVLIKGSHVTNVREYEYRGFKIISKVKPHDFRNKTHPGYSWFHTSPSIPGETWAKSKHAAMLRIDFDIAKAAGDQVEIERVAQVHLDRYNAKIRRKFGKSSYQIEKPILK